MNVHVLQHVPFEGIGSIASWLELRKAKVAYTRFFEDDRLPGLDRIDLVIAMGGPMSANDENRYPWLIAEKRFLRSAIEDGLPVLGICLGAQLMASALGARVCPGQHKEIGWFPITSVPADTGAFSFPESTQVLHWHGETFDLPIGARLLASSTACRNQAFQLGSKAIGLQFHLETTPASLDEIIINCREELVEGPFIQSERTIRGAPGEAFLQINQLMEDILCFVTR